MNQLGKVRLISLRVFYFLVGTGFVFLASTNSLYEQIGNNALESIIKSVLFAVSLLALIGVFQPLKMLPLLFFSVFWKFILLAAFIIPSYVSNELDNDLKNILVPMSIGLLVTLIVIPWKYAINHFFTFK
jgi:hypothetical membrane protein